MVYGPVEKAQRTVAPAKAGVQKLLNSLDFRFRGNDESAGGRPYSPDR